jgi:hypothetical protein
MTQQSAFFPLVGGLDEVTQAISVPSGRAINARNYEPVSQGYGRIDGYERFDGRTGPTAAAASLDAANDTAGAYNLRNSVRATIQAVPGSGPVRGVWRFKGITYAWRDNVGATACIMWKGTSSGWAAVDTGFALQFTSGGTYEVHAGDMLTAATGAGTALVKNVILVSGTWAGGDAAGFFVLDAPVGTFTPGNLNVGTNTNVATFAAAPAAQTFPPGGRYYFRTHNFYGQVGTKAMYGANGVGKAFEYDGSILSFVTTGSIPDNPKRVGVHNGHLYLAFPGGSLQASAPGEPLNYRGVDHAFEVGTGDEIVDLMETTSSLIVLCQASIGTITGSDADDVAYNLLTEEAGAKPDTVQSIGSAVYVDNRGVRSVTTTQAYGNFKLGTMTQLAVPFLERRRGANAYVVASVRVRNKDQYRLYYSDGTGLSIYFGRKSPEVMPISVPITVSCMCSIEDDDGTEVIFAGAQDGYVYQMETGRSFDGQVIDAVLQLPFNHEGSPRLLKRWAKAVIELVSQPETNIGMMPIFDYGSFDQPNSPITYFNAPGGGGLWDIADWNLFQWSAPIESTIECFLEGMGANMSLVIACSSDNQRAHILQGITLMYAIRGQRR